MIQVYENFQKLFTVDENRLLHCMTTLKITNISKTKFIARWRLLKIGGSWLGLLQQWARATQIDRFYVHVWIYILASTGSTQVYNFSRIL